MPYKFKDDGSHIIKPFTRKIYFIIGCLTIARPVIGLIISGEIDFLGVMNIALGVLLIWGVNKNGFYKLARWYKERQLRKFDNKWRR